MTSHRLVLSVVAVVCLLAPCTLRQARADQPLLGFNGTLVQLPERFGFGHRVKGMKVQSVSRNSPAARMGLERGDIVVTIDSVAFKSHSGYRAALRMSSQRPSLIVVNVRNGQLTRLSGDLPHERETGEHPDTMGLAIDLVEDMQGR